MAAVKTKPRPQMGAPYHGPYGTPVSHVGYREARHMNPERIPYHRHEKAVSIRLLDVSRESLENVQKVAANIKRLLAPSLRLKTVPESLVAYLEHLEKLDLSHNHLSDASFPDCMKTLDCLMELRLNDNQLTKIPPCLRRLKNLTRLDLSNNQLDSGSGLEKLRKLQMLVLDNNHLSSLFKEINGLRRLEILRCSGNSLRDVPRDVRNLRALTDLDLSNNRIVLLPTDIFLLPRLESLNASQNQVGKVPTFNVKVQNKHWISSVDLSDNNLVKFPGHLMFLANKLDLSSNKIRTLSWATLKKLDWDRDQELIIDSNPLCYPPQEVCESGLRSIMQFFQEAQSDVKTYQGVKVLVVGSHRSGKSSLIHSLVDQQARLSDEMTDTAAGIDAYEMSFDYDVEEGKPGKSLNLCLWDFCGHPFYLYPHYIFHEQPSITILTFSMPDYSEQNFAQQIGSWFDWMIAKTNKLVAILVGTKSDKVSAQRAKEITQQVREKLSAHLQRRQTMIEQRIKEIEKRPVISPTLSEQLKAYMKLLQAKFTVQTEVIVTSAKKFMGFDKLREAIEALANDRKLFPNVMRVIPTFWVEVETWAEERGNALVVPVMQWEEFQEEVTQKFGMKHLLVSITQYLHESGKVLWFSNVPSLKKLVFLRPSWLFDVLKQLFRHDLEAMTFTPDETLKAIAFTPAKFDRLKQELLSDGVVDRELLKGLLVSLMPADVNKPSAEVLQILKEGLEFGYPVAKRTRDGNNNFTPEKDSEGNIKLNRVLIPWFRTCAEPTSFREKWTELQERRHLAVMFKFPCYMPPGLFELMTVRAHLEKHKLVFLAHWGGGIHAKHGEEKLHLLIVYYQEGVHEEEGVGQAKAVWQEEGEDKERGVSMNGARPKNSTIPRSAKRAEGAKSTDESKDSVFVAESELSATNMESLKTNTPQVSKPETKHPLTNGDSSSNPTKRRKSRKETDADIPETIEEDDEDKDVEDEDEQEMSVGGNRRLSKMEDSETQEPEAHVRIVVERENSEEKVVEEARQTPVRDVTSPMSVRSFTGSPDDDESSIVLKFEIRDNSEDEADQVPAATMWNVLLPLLMDFEELLQGYTGVLVERRTECPICGEASFLGEWLTPKETQSLNTRTCDTCGQQVDTAFLVQPREKKRDDVMRAIIRRTVRGRRGAAVTSDLDDLKKVAPLNPRRGALNPLDIGDDSLRRLLGHRGSEDL